MDVDCGLCVRQGGREREKETEYHSCERVRVSVWCASGVNVYECVREFFSHSYLNSESEYRQKSDGPLSSVRSRNVHNSA